MVGAWRAVINSLCFIQVLLTYQTRVGSGTLRQNVKKALASPTTHTQKLKLPKKKNRGVNKQEISREEMGKQSFSHLTLKSLLKTCHHLQPPAITSIAPTTYGKLPTSPVPHYTILAHSTTIHFPLVNQSPIPLDEFFVLCCGYIWNHKNVSYVYYVHSLTLYGRQKGGTHPCVIDLYTKCQTYECGYICNKL